MLATVLAATITGVQGAPVRVEVHVGGGLPGYSIVGLPDTACRESRDRVRAAVLSSGLSWPDRRVTVNLAPSAVRKVGTGLDLAIAVGILVASGQLAATHIEGRAFLGELGLSGAVRPIPGVLPMAAALEVEELVVPARNAAEAEMLGRHRARPAERLADLVACLEGSQPWPPVPSVVEPPGAIPGGDLAEVRGQLLARRALEVAVAGGHHLLLVGPPGAGKTMLAERAVGLMGQLDDEAALRASVVHSAAGLSLPSDGLLRCPPFRSPHHSASLVSIIGGGTHAIRPGEISLATGGILFLDELGEFPPSVLDALRQPLEMGTVSISRSHGSATLPAEFLLIAAMNPCPCGRAPTPACRCSAANLARYARRVSGPILDRLDLRVVVNAPSREELLEAPAAESTAVVAERVTEARDRARHRGVRCNGRLRGADLERYASLAPDAEDLLGAALRDGRLTGRGLARVRAVALTLTDLAGRSGPLDRATVAEALALRAPLHFDRWEAGPA